VASQWHTFGASCNPATNTAAWWLDNSLYITAMTPDVLAIATQQHFYLILDCSSHKKKTPYSMLVRSAKAYVPEDAAPSHSVTSGDQMH
jgi:hypothetical protein